MHLILLSLHAPLFRTTSMEKTLPVTKAAVHGANYILQTRFWTDSLNARLVYLGLEMGISRTLYGEQLSMLVVLKPKRAILLRILEELRLRIHAECRSAGQFTYWLLTLTALCPFTLHFILDVLPYCRYAKPGNCAMSKFKINGKVDWETAMMQDDSPCEPSCPPEGCFWEVHCFLSVIILITHHFPLFPTTEELR